ncbi:similar to 3-ketoacyl-CoA thiolase [Plenodomus lingam JN3]|uniref:Similar to 3-ketoacyl-CoA thiolase n=1 Tax=Leptosphaeria maculans (strain JN3 / isolate v23.1.3 / race Av1-4-5-6-7-8) TaxID=985895 RepID=E4ZI31_LEPMJ|nr:similar to 3-ketoacyl-CoA thiolase [Plenodomus lingam JN3]CBX91174.1 similar to 3-ketoacyl-CoA thiolase [Plenodomus lingam JN3]
MAFIQKGVRNILQRNPHDVVFLSALRTPVTRAKKGGLRDAYDHELLGAVGLTQLCMDRISIANMLKVLKATISKFPNLDPAKIDEITIGTVLAELGGSKAGRMAANHVGIPTTTSFSTVNRACASGLSAITSIANSIAVGQIEVGIAGGMESMTRNYGSRAIPTELWPEMKDSPVKQARDCIMSMGITSENVAERYGVSRADQDAFAAQSQKRAAAAQAAGRFDAEIVPVTTRWIEPENPETVKEVTVTKDDGIRANTTIEKLATMKPAFKSDGTSTAGNSSQVSDGASAALMMRRSTATALGLESHIIGKWAGTQVVGCQPDEMGVGPALAIPKLLNYTGLETSDVQLWEINEAFASQALYCVRKLGLENKMDRVNPNGGAIALGHPLGATSGRMLATLLSEMERSGEQVGVLSKCIGTGMGMASLIVRE